jgi:hypothetical protein
MSIRRATFPSLRHRKEGNVSHLKLIHSLCDRPSEFYDTSER